MRALIRATLAQSAEHLTRNEKVASSILAGGSTRESPRGLFIQVGCFVDVLLVAREGYWLVRFENGGWGTYQLFMYGEAG